MRITHYEQQTSGDLVANIQARCDQELRQAIVVDKDIDEAHLLDSVVWRQEETVVLAGWNLFPDAKRRRVAQWLAVSPPTEVVVIITGRLRGVRTFLDVDFGCRRGPGC